MMLNSQTLLRYLVLTRMCVCVQWILRGSGTPAVVKEIAVKSGD